MVGVFRMSKERLKEISYNVGYSANDYDNVLIKEEDYLWLRKQAERVGELEYEKAYLLQLGKVMQKKINEEEHQNKRYREAIGAIEDLYNQLNDNAEIVDGIMMVVRKTVKALEELK